MTAATIMISKQNRLIQLFEERDATSAPAAVTLSELGLSPSFVIKRMVARGVLINTTNDRFYLGREAADKFRRSRKIKVFVVVSLAAALHLYLQVRS